MSRLIRPGEEGDSAGQAHQSPKRETPLSEEGRGNAPPKQVLSVDFPPPGGGVPRKGVTRGPDRTPESSPPDKPGIREYLKSFEKYGAMAEQVRAFVDKSRNPLYSNPVYLEKVVRQIVLKNLKPNQKIPEFLPEADKKRIMAKRQRDKELAAGQARLNYKLQNLRRR